MPQPKEQTTAPQSAAAASGRRSSGTRMRVTSAGASLDQALASMWVAYQPIVRAGAGSLFGYEALLRSDEPTLPDPGAFLDAAERLGRLHDVGRVVRERASLPMVSIPPPTLLLEITERASLDAIGDVPSRMARLREHGFRIAIDDLGAGYSGLTSFTSLAPDFVKLDMSLIRDIHKTPVKRKLVHFVTALCRDLGVTVVAEGIEVAEERDAILELGCDLLQGYLFGKPARPRAPDTL